MAQSKDDGADKANVAATGKATDAKPKAAVAPAPKTTTKAAKAKVAKPAAKTPAKRAAKKPVARKKPATERAPAKAAVKKTVAAPAKKTVQTTQEFITMTTPEAFTKNMQDTMADVTAKSKAAYEKGTEFAAEATEFTKGNIEAVVESSKIFASGIQEMSRALLADSKSEFEGLTAEVKEMASVKSPTDFFQLQSAMMRKYFDKSVAAASKNTEVMLKLANDAAQPLSSRVALAMEKVKAA